jgi:hypothetical protein
VQRHREQVHVPRPAEVRGHHRQPRERRRDRVQLERVRVVEPDALPAGLAGADAACPGVEQGEQPLRLAGGEHGPELLVVRRERLQRRMELDAAEPGLGDLGDLVDGRLLVRVDRADAGERAWMLAYRGGHRRVRHPGAPGRGLGVPGEQHRHRVKRQVLGR